MRPLPGLLLAFLVTGAPLLASASVGAAPFFVAATDITQPAGIDFVHAGFHAGTDVNQAGYYEAMAGGACWGDFDQDGRLDLFLTDFLGPGGDGGSRLYRNAGPGGPAGWRFEDVTVAQHAGLRGVGSACSWGDYDNDGWPDLYASFVMTNFSLQGNVLLHNLGRGRGFEDVTAAARVGGQSTGAESPACNPLIQAANGTEVPRCWSVSSAWLDYDQDGLLDLYVANYVQFPFGSCTNEYPGDPRFCQGQANRLYHNRGDGAFDDVAVPAGVAYNEFSTLGRSLGVVATDLDGDGWPDLYVANDMDGNALYLNNRNGTFRSVATALGVDNLGATSFAPGALYRAGMGVAAQDFDNDGAVDLISTHLNGQYDGLYRRDGDHWTDVGVAAGTASLSTGPSRWGVGFEDFDLDGWKDLLVVGGGHGRMEPGGIQLFLQRDHRFTFSQEPNWPFARTDRENYRGAAFADFDNDGDMDVLATALPTWQNGSGPPRPRLLQFHFADDLSPPPQGALPNAVNPAGGNHWLRVTLEGTDGARDAVGAAVIVRAGNLTQWRWAVSGGSYAGTNDPRLLLGLGRETRGSIEVIWPGNVSGGAQTFDLAGKPGLELRLKEPDRKAPAGTAWVAPRSGASTSGETVLQWNASWASDFRAYRVYQGPHPGFAPNPAPVAEITDRGAPTFLAANFAAGRYFRVTVVDHGGHESVPSLDLHVEGGATGPGGAPTPAPGLLLVALAAVAGAVLSRRRPIG